MFKKLVGFSAVMLFLFSLSGCLTARKQSAIVESQEVKNQVSVLEAQIQSKDEEINSLREALTKAQSEAKPEATQEGSSKKNKIIGEEKSRPSGKHVQMALKNAGYNPGRSDGKLGKQSREALRAFQKANNLKETGKADKETWDLLKEYLHKKSK
jgi:cell division septum initiation protein DivIVA